MINLLLFSLVAGIVAAIIIVPFTSATREGRACLQSDWGLVCNSCSYGGSLRLFFITLRIWTGIGRRYGLCSLS